MKKQFKILIIGSDVSYYRKLEDEFRSRLDQSMLVIETVSPTRDQKINQILSEVMNKKPDVAFVDIDVESDKMLRLIQFMAKHDYYHEHGLVGLAARIPAKEGLPWTFLEQGAHFFFCKSIETVDVTLQILSRYYFETPQLENYFVKNIPSKQEFKLPLRIGSYSESGVHIEGFLCWDVGQPMEIKFHQNFIEQTFLFRLNQKSDNNCYYPFPWNGDLTVDFVHTISPNYEEEKAKLTEQMANKNQYIKDTAKFQLDKYHQQMKALKVLWQDRVGELMEQAVPKYLRVLALDPELSIYNLSSDDFDIYPFSVRIHRHIVEKHFVKERPDVICWIIPSGALSGNVEQYFISMLDIIDKQNDYSPIIVIFNSPFSHDFYSELSPGRNVVVDSGPVDMALILHYVALFMEDEEVIKKEETPEAYFPDKNDPESFALANVEVDVVGMSESFILFTCDYPLMKGCHLYWNSNHHLSMTVMSMPQLYNGKKYFVGFFQALNEVEKRDLRAEVNLRTLRPVR